MLLCACVCVVFVCSLCFGMCLYLCSSSISSTSSFFLRLLHPL